MVKRVRLSFAKGLEVEFIDRDRAIKQVYELGGRVLGIQWLFLVLRAVAKPLGFFKQLKFSKSLDLMLFTLIH
jgi:hypothetical protein